MILRVSVRLLRGVPYLRIRKVQNLAPSIRRGRRIRQWNGIGVQLGHHPFDQRFALQDFDLRLDVSGVNRSSALVQRHGIIHMQKAFV